MRCYPVKKAFLVGINKYPGSALNGCVNDVVLMTKVLTEKYGFKTEDMRIATDLEATRDNIVNGLRWLAKSACPGDTLVFHYSGHGSQVPVEDPYNTDEPDGFDEILCPVDIDFYKNIYIRDHETGFFFKSLPTGVNSLVILDCCHSGTGLRNGIAKPLPEGVKNRFLAPPISSMLLSPSTSIDEDLGIVKKPLSKGFFTRSCVDLTDKQGETILISGCKDNQTSADAYINGRYHGALTYYLVDILKEHNWKLSYSHLVNQVNKKMDGNSYEQDPMLEGKKELVSKNFLT